MKSVEANFLQCAVRPRTRLPSPERTEAVAARGAVQQHTLTSTTRAEKVVALPPPLSVCVCRIGGGCYDFSVCDGLFFHWKPVFFPDNIFVFHTHGVPVATTSDISLTAVSV